MQITRLEFDTFAELKECLAKVQAAQVLYLRCTTAGKIRLGVSDTIIKVTDKKSITVTVELGDPSDSELAYIGRGDGFTVVESIGFATNDLRQLVDAFGAVIDRTKTRDVYTADAWRKTDSIVYYDSGTMLDTGQLAGVSSVRAMGGYIFGISDGVLIAGDTTKSMNRLDSWQKLSDARNVASGSTKKVYHFTPSARVGRLVMAGGKYCWSAQIFDRGIVYHVTMFTSDCTFMVTREDAVRSFQIGVLGGDQSNGQIVSVEPKPVMGSVEINLQQRGR